MEAALTRSRLAAAATLVLLAPSILRAGELPAKELSAAIYDTFDRLARSSPYGRIVSDRVSAK